MDGKEETKDSQMNFKKWNSSGVQYTERSKLPDLSKLPLAQIPMWNYNIHLF